MWWSISFTKLLHILWNEPMQWQCHQFVIYPFFKINLLIHAIFIGCRWRWWGHCPSPAGRRKHLTETLPSSCQKTSKVFFFCTLIQVVSKEFYGNLHDYNYRYCKLLIILWLWDCIDIKRYILKKKSLFFSHYRRNLGRRKRRTQVIKNKVS